MPNTAYPWFETISGDDLEQGDILESIPVFRPPDDLGDWNDAASAFFTAEERNLLVVSQTCDLVKGREKLSEVLFTPVWNLSRYKAGEYLATPKGREEARRGTLPGVHLIAACKLPGMEREIRVVDFRQVFTLPLAFVRKRAEEMNRRLRLLPPYREHLAQSFARYFMRIGLPVDIPPFK